ncbi:MAG TPA: glycosyl hydrolase family 28 protein [Verrucomicrobiae bacterium]|nr:glycosyl hydrolase family 28 protein [Verrucomicrobiae bacterium]
MSQSIFRFLLAGAFLPAFLGSLFLSGIRLEAGPARTFNVRDYGATGRKEDNARPSVQKAIDACAAAGGGTVLIPPGLYTSGTLRLRSHIRVELAEGATLYASTDAKAYDCGPIVSKAALFYGEDLEDVSFGGRGIVDGQAQYDWRPDDFEQNFEHKKLMQGLGKSLMRSFPKDFPNRQIYPHLVWLGRCNNIRFNGLNFLHAPIWTFALYACRNATFDGLYIYSSLKEAVWADGIDLDGCQNVSIANCSIETGDDCVALVSATNWGPALVCENISVTNCRLSSASAGIKFSEGNIAGIQNIQVTHSLFNNVNRGFALITALGGSISNVLLSDLTIDCSRFDWFWAGDAQPFYCRSFRLSELDPSLPKSKDPPPAPILQLTLRNIVAHAKGSSLFYGHSERWLDGITLENVKLFVSTDPTAPYDRAEHVLDFRRITNLKLKDVEVVWEKPFLFSWKSALNFEDIHGLDIDGFTTGPARSQSDVPIIALRQVSGAMIRHARAAKGTDIFIDIAGPASHNIRFQNNDLNRAKVPFHLAKDLPWEAVERLDNR